MNLIGLIKLIWRNLTRPDIAITVRAPKEKHVPVKMETYDTYTIATGKSKIVLRKTGFRDIEVVLIPPDYVKKNWENCNALDRE